MQTFSILEATPTSQDLERFTVLAPSLRTYLEGTFDLVGLRLAGGLAGEQRFYFALDRLSRLPGRALKMLGCANAREVMDAARYECGMLGGDSRHAFVPLGVVSTAGGLSAYVPALRKFGDDPALDAVELLPDLERFNVLDLKDQHLSFDAWVNRFEQVYLGCGLTWGMLCKKEVRAHLEPVSMALSTGDTLVGFAYAVEPMATAGPVR